MMMPQEFNRKKLVLVNLTQEPFIGARLSLRNEGLRISDADNRTIDKIPLRLVSAVFVIGETTVTTQLLRAFRKHAVALFFLNRSLRVTTPFYTPAQGNTLLRRHQYALTDEEHLKIARRIVLNKINNQIALMTYGATAQQRTEFRRERFSVRRAIEGAEDFRTLLGVEGSYSAKYFSRYFAQIGWRRRMPRIKEDHNNLLLDIGYTMLFSFTSAVLQLFCFDVYYGHYHRTFYQRESLTCDIMEPLRPIIDRSLVKLHTLGVYDDTHFTHTHGTYQLSYKHQGRYVRHFLSDITRHKDMIYEYIRAHYYAILNRELTPRALPFFRIR